MSNADQLTEIDALESIFGNSFSALCDKHIVKIQLQPFLIEDADNVNHVKADVYAIFGQTYPTNPLYSVFVEASGMDEFKAKRFQDYIQDQINLVSGPNNGTKLMLMSSNKMGEAEQQFKKTFFDELHTFNQTPLINDSPSKSAGDIYLFEIFDVLREWLVNNNTREVKTLRDMVQNIDQIDEAARIKALKLLEEPELETKAYVDPYDLIDNVFTMEYEGDIPIEVGQPCTNEVFEKWSAVFLEQQKIYRLKVLAEQGKIDTSTQMTGKQLFLNNMVQDLLDDDDQGASSFTYVRPVATVEQDQTEDGELLEVEEGQGVGGDIEIDLDFDIDESLFDMSSDDDDYVPTPQPEVKPVVTAPPKTLSQPKLEEKKSSSKKDGKKDDKKDDKKDKKSSSSSKKDTKKDNKKAGGFGDLGGGFSDFLGDF